MHRQIQHKNRHRALWDISIHGVIILESGYKKYWSGSSCWQGMSLLSSNCQSKLLQIALNRRVLQTVDGVIAILQNGDVILCVKRGSWNAEKKEIYWDSKEGHLCHRMGAGFGQGQGVFNVVFIKILCEMNFHRKKYIFKGLGDS